ncbi:hypothetical protein ACFSHT_28935 [Paraburkholderia silviterrae]|uniref:Uncharacterized protein n=1 Tax=Paraburkholderia silviterrae TaxID=2528715 RepID=A0A4R5M6D5_9BURK|nr:hypothetical protein [Paraburkholderia silviterrae]TDG21146.1 hypothetical protein EYW47_22515 [Paraburkholderia silviterrae]
MTLSFDEIRTLYRQAIDPRASDHEPSVWWDAVAEEMREVMSASTDREAAALIEWWHNDWTSVSDTPVAAARRIRRTARQMMSRVRERT